MASEPNTDQRFIFSNLLFRSSAYAIAAYFLAYLTERLLMALGAFLLNFTVKLTYNDLSVYGIHADWTQETVIAIYLFPQLTLAGIVVAIYLIYQRKKSEPDNLSMFLLWIIYFFAYRSLGMIPFQFLYQTDMFHAFRWLYLGYIIRTITGCGITVLYLIFSAKVLQVIYFMAGTMNRNIKTIGNHDLIMSSIFFPSSAVVVVAMFYFLPFPPMEELTSMSLIAMPAIYCFIKLKLKTPPFLVTGIFIKEKRNPQVILAVILISIIAVRVWLGFGLALN
jgi:hypothetical protein